MTAETIIDEPLEIHDLEQGSPEWIAHRYKKRNASDAAAMLGVDPNKTRAQLLHECYTASRPDAGTFLQAVYDRGHEYEAKARPLAEELIGETLYPITCSRGLFGCSLDGIVMSHRVNWEHKQMNEHLRALFDMGGDELLGSDLPLHNRVQMEHQMLVTRAKKTLFSATAWSGDTCIAQGHAWYLPDLELRERIVRGWELFERDLAEYVPPPVKAAEPVAKVIPSLPALVVVTKAEVVQSNLPAYVKAATEFMASINTDLKTDQDFVDAAETVKFCEKVEQGIALVKQQILGQSASIEEIFRALDDLDKVSSQKRLQLSKLGTTRKAEIKAEIKHANQALLDKHVASLNERLGMPWVPRTFGAFDDAMKNLRSFESMRAACSQHLADQKLRLNALADLLDKNRKALLHTTELGVDDYLFLFADFATVGSQPAEAFAAIAAQRIQRHKDDEAERKRKREAAAQAAAAPAVAPPPAPAAGPVGAVGTLVGSGMRGFAAGRAAQAEKTDTRPPINLTDLRVRIGLHVTEDQLRSLGFEPVKKDRNSKFYAQADIPAMCRAIIAALQQVILSEETPF